MKMTYNETSFVLPKSIIAYDVDAYGVRSMINSRGYWVSHFAGSSRAQKLNKAQKK